MSLKPEIRKPSIRLSKHKLLVLIFFLIVLIYHQFDKAELLSNPEKQESLECNFQTVLKVIDGDTFTLSDGTKIRLLGVDTPETVDPRKDVHWYGREASKKLTEWVEGKAVCLKQDQDKTQDVDKYGRLLRYAWKYASEKDAENDSKGLNGFFVNAELIKQGYGFAYTKYPFQYLDEFRKYERDARLNNRGLWDRKKQAIWEKEIEKNKRFAAACGKTEILCPEDALNHIGKQKTVRLFVKKSYDSGKTVFLNSKNNYEDYDNFTAVIFDADRKKFSPEPAEFYWGKTVDVTGKIKEYKGRAEIILENSSQIKIVN
ncbi:MAG: thermonuclease family protein [Nitrospirota bacterium]